ncbi:MAG: alpha-amylase family glycosyl hydrolase [Bacteroidota bacterium]
MKKMLLLLLGAIYAINLSAQLIATDPVFPRASEEVTVFFNAKEGDSGLENCNCDIYGHFGIITQESTNPSDWQNVPTTWGEPNADWLMTPVPGQDQVYSFTFTPSINDYFTVEMNQEVLELAFVFRNSDGTQTGKADGGQDIFYPVYPEDLPLTAIFVNPSQSETILELGESITIRGAASEAAELVLIEDGLPLTMTTGTSIEYELNVTEPGTHLVELFVDNGSETDVVSFTYAVPIDVPAADLPSGTELGFNLIGDTSLILALYAPNKENVFVLTNINDWALTTDLQMTPTPDGTTWWTQLDGLEPGQNYFYQYLVDGNLKIADPYSTLILDPNADGEIDDVTFPDLPDYPAEASGFLTWLRPGAEEYEWQVNDFERPEQTELVVYELLVRDFIETHNYQTMIDTLDYLENLGVNAIELMPVQEFENNNSWGYNPSFHMALDKYYGTPNKFKEFVDACHERGLAVIVDVVYNHAFGQSPLVQLYFENGAPSPESPWFNESPTHPFNVGFDFNHEAQVTRDFVKQTITYWLEEFRLDGFRFDLSKGFTQTPNPDNVGAWGQYDESRITILKEYADHVWDVTPGAYVILEHFAVNTEEHELSDYGMMLWGNNHFSFENAVKGNSASLNNVSYKARGFNDPHVVQYMESHDEERLVYSALETGQQINQFHNVRDLNVALRRVELASAIFYTVPGPKMLWQFGEQGYDVSINFNGRTGPKPIRWYYLDEADRNRLRNVTASLMNLRKDYEVFHTEDFQIAISNVGSEAKAKRVNLTGTDMNVITIGNFDVFDNQMVVAFPTTGVWYEYFSGDSLNVEELQQVFELTPSEYRMYTDVPLEEPVGGYIQTTGTKELVADLSAFSLRPNPATDWVQVHFTLRASSEVVLQLVNQAGQQVFAERYGVLTAGNHQLDLSAEIGPGVYYLQLQTESGTETRKLVVLE